MRDGKLTFYSRVGSFGCCCIVAAFILLNLISSPCLAQTRAAQPKQPPEMLVTSEGFLAIETPKGWVRTEGPGLAFFVREGENSKTADVWIYVNSAPVGPKEDAKDLQAFIQSDIAGFKERFKSGIVREERPIELPHAKIRVHVYAFESAEKHNSFEEAAYIPENGRVLILVLSAKNKVAYAKSVQDFRAFAESYRGSIRESGTKQP